MTLVKRGLLTSVVKNMLCNAFKFGHIQLMPPEACLVQGERQVQKKIQ